MQHKAFAYLLLTSFLLAPLSCTQNEAKTGELEVKGWITNLDGSQKVAPLPSGALSQKECASLSGASGSITIDPSTSFQTITGFGAALTESSAILLDKMSERARAKTLSDLFGGSGTTRLSILRIPVGATDFSTGNFSCADSDSDETPKSVAKLFHLERCMGKILPMLAEIKRIRPSLKIMATPWSPPAWMKSTRSMVGGKLLPRFFPQYAEYLSLYLEKMEQAGIPVDYLTVINEPLYVEEREVTYPWANMDPEEQAEFIGKFLGPLLKNKGLLGKVKILGYDHNWDKWNFPAKILKNPETEKYVAGTAFHCYRGEYSAAQQLHDLFPNKEIHLSECTSGKWSPRFQDSFEWAMNHLFIGHFSAGAQSLIYWNLLLDAEGGPKNGGCQDCRGVINLNSEGNEIEKSPEYYVLAQASLAVEASGRRILSTAPGLNTQIAFQNPDSSLGWVGGNFGDSVLALEFKTPRGCFSMSLPPKSTVSLRW